LKYSKKPPTSAAKAVKKEWDKFCKYNDVKYLPICKPWRVLGAIDDAGQPKEPVYAFGHVIERGLDLKKGKESC